MKTNELARAGMTAIEILIVIAFIAIIAGFSLPAYKAVRDKTRRASCMSNMKQFGQAIMLYQSEWGIMPWSWNGTDNWDNCLGAAELISKSDFAELYCPQYVQDNGTPTNRTYCMPLIQQNRTMEMFDDVANTVLLGENRNGDASECQSIGAAFNQAHDSRHGGGSNYLFMDGHVEYLVPGEANGKTWPNIP